MGDETNVTKFPQTPKPPELLVGPFEEYRVVVEGRMIPGLTGLKKGDKETTLCLDHRLMIHVPNEIAHSVAWLLANALAIGAGYSHMGASSKNDQPFAPQAMSISEPDQ